MAAQIALSPAQAETIALEFLRDEWQLSAQAQDWFTVLACRPIGESWYVVEISVEGLPDKWVLQVYDTGSCDPNYTFISPLADSADVGDLSEFPQEIIDILCAERHCWLVPRP